MKSRCSGSRKAFPSLMKMNQEEEGVGFVTHGNLPSQHGARRRTVQDPKGPTTGSVLLLVLQVDASLCSGQCMPL